MRAGPLGAYFADDIDEVVRQARASAEVTHAHPDGQAGAVAVAVAAAMASQMAAGQTERSGHALLKAVHQYTPIGQTKEGLLRASETPFSEDARVVARTLGSGDRVLSWDTVPYSLWCAARHLDNSTEAMWATVSGLGDRDTTCAIVGSVVALSCDRPSIPADWLAARENLK